MKLIGVILLAVLMSFLVLLSSLPLGVPGEWVWPRQALPSDLAEWLDRFLSPLLFGAAAVAFCRFADCRISSAGCLKRSLLVLSLVIVAFFWQRMAVNAASSPHRELRPLWVLYDKYASGYFFNAVFRSVRTADILPGYEAKMAEGDVLHEGTHPPGLLLLNLAAKKATEEWPELAAVSPICVSATSVKVFRDLERTAGLARPLTRLEFAALCLVSLVTSIFSATAVVPVYLIVARLANPQTAWRTACLSLTAPGITMFLPRSDVLYVSSGAWLMLTIVLAVSARSWIPRVIWSMLGAVVLAMCLVVSLAHLPVLMAGGLFGLLAWWKPSDTAVPLSIGRLVTIAGVAAASFTAIVFLFERYTDCNLWNVWQLNLRNHEGFYSTSVRTWWKWALVNPLELGFTAGLPVAVIAYWHILTMALNSLRSRSLIPWSQVDCLSLAFAVTWMCLWLSGKNMGEAARLWCFMTPWVAIVASAGLLNGDSQRPEPAERKAIGVSARTSQRIWVSLLASQFIVGLLTTGLVSGYLEM